MQTFFIVNLVNSVNVFKVSKTLNGFYYNSLLSIKYKTITRSSPQACYQESIYVINILLLSGRT